MGHCVIDPNQTSLNPVASFTPLHLSQTWTVTHAKTLQALKLMSNIRRIFVSGVVRLYMKPHFWYDAIISERGGLTLCEGWGHWDKLSSTMPSHRGKPFRWVDWSCKMPACFTHAPYNWTKWLMITPSTQNTHKTEITNIGIVVTQQKYAVNAKSRSALSGQQS